MIYKIDDADGYDKIPDLQEAINERLLRDTDDAGGFEDKREIITHNSESDSDEQVVFVSSCFERVEVACLRFSLSFQAERRLDLLNFKGHKRRVLVTNSMVFDNEGVNFLVASL